MDFEVMNFKVVRTAHVYFSKEWESRRFLIYGLHGYGQSAQAFFSLFHTLNASIGFCAPEGLSKFYWKGFHGDVVSSWMTKDHREDEIIDYINYLTGLHNVLLESSSKKVYLGFSQGSTTLLRWMENAGIRSGIVILIGNKIANEMIDYLKSSNLKIYLIYGDNDIFISKESREEHLDYLKSIGLKYTSKVLNAKHVINDEIVNYINQLVDPIAS